MTEGRQQLQDKRYVFTLTHSIVQSEVVTVWLETGQRTLPARVKRDIERDGERRKRAIAE